MNICKFLRRPCKHCGFYFTPTGRDCRVCDECCEKSRKIGIKKMKKTMGYE